MNQNYMNYFNPASSAGMSGVDSGNGGAGLNDFANQANFLGANMPPMGGSFMEMINSGPPPMMSTPGQPMARYNHPYSSMYGATGYGGMGNSAMRLQQFASRQIAPRHSFDMANQMNQEQINPYYMQQMRKMRMMSMPEFASQRFNTLANVHPGWSRNMMPNMPPHLQQMSSPPQNRVNTMMPNAAFNSDVNSSLQIQNMQGQQNQSPGAYRKMPVLDEAPPPLRGPSPFSQQQQQQSFSPQFSNQDFSANQPNTPNSLSSNQTNSLDLNAPLNVTDNLKLPNMTFPSPRQAQSGQQQQTQPSQQPQVSQSQPQPQPSPQQQQTQGPLSNFLSSLNVDQNSSLSVPQSPKLTHFGPSPASVSSTGSFDQSLSLSSSPTTPITQVTQTLSYASPSSYSSQLSQANKASITTSSARPSAIQSPNHVNTAIDAGPFFRSMAQIQQQINLLKQVVPTPETNNQIQMLSQQYAMIYKQYGASKTQNHLPGFQDQLPNRTIPSQPQIQPPLYRMPSPQPGQQHQQTPMSQIRSPPQQQPQQNPQSSTLLQLSDAIPSTQNLQQQHQPPPNIISNAPQQIKPSPSQQPKPQEQITQQKTTKAPVTEISTSSLLDDSLVDSMEGINIPEFDSLEKVSFLNDDNKTDSLFSSAFLAGSDLFQSSSLFNDDSLDVLSNKTEDTPKKSENTITPVKGEETAKSYQELSSTTTVLSSGDQKQNVFQGDNQQHLFASNNFNMNLNNNFSHQLLQQQPQHHQQQQQHQQQPIPQQQQQQQQPIPQQQQQPIPQQQQQQQSQQNSQYLPFPFNQHQFVNHPGNQVPANIMMSMTNFMSQTISTMPNNLNMSSSGPMNPLMGKPISSLPGMSADLKQEALSKQKGKGKGAKGKGGKGTGKGGKGTGKGKAGRPPGSLNKKKRDDKAKKFADLEPDDFDNLPPDELLSKETDDPAMRRSLRERHKNTNYKDDFDYNISDEDEDKKNKEGKEGVEEDGETTAKPVLEHVISGGANQLVGYRPTVEVEGEIAIIEKILAMRTTQKDEVKEGEDPMIEEFFVKYKAYSYLHCEWGTVDYLAKKDKRIYAKVKRYKQKRDTSFAFLNELDDEPFNPDYIEIDRVLDYTTTADPVTNETIEHYLVKWRALPYEDSTWELKINIDESVIQQYEEMKKPPPVEQRRFMPRPQESEWKKLPETPTYKNGNKLRDYQLEGLNWLTFCWFKRINCILADEMGLGKTVQSISLLCAMKQYGIRGPFLVIAPLSTIANWQREFENWTDINAIVYHGSMQSRNNIQQYEMYYKNENGENISEVYKFEAIITTYEIVLSANSFLCTIPFRCLVIDEAHRLKNQKCKLMEGLNNLKMEHRVLLTGTPLQNNVEELFSLLNFLEPTRFPSNAAFMYEFGDLKTEAQVDKLKQILKPMMLRRLKEDVEANIASKEETIVEVELTTIQKKFYRAILERNFSFLAKGSGYSNLPNLMNTMMELRKCCNHPFLIKGARDKISSEYMASSQDPEKQFTHLNGLIESSGKMVLIDKLLPKLKTGGHKVLIFSQMIKVLNLIQEYLIEKRYQFERIDGGVQGNMRQAAIDRFCRPDSDRFVFLLCTRAGGLGINLTAADTVIIFDSDWNPQNDLQAQARCHRIGQDKPVKVYRLICRNTYEREMFDRASLKLGLDKAVLQNINQKENTGQKAMSKKEVEDLLKKGAYGAVMETDEDANKFCEEDIDQILQRRTQIVQIQGEGKGSTFSKASFVSDKARLDVDLDDPDFWKKWAKKASVSLEDLQQDKQLIVDEPRKRKQTRRFGNDGDANVEMSDLDSDDETYEPHKGKSKASTPVGPIERAAWTRVECFKVEKLLLVYGWDRWQEIISHAHFRQEVKNTDVEAISRTILAYCYRFYKTDDRSKQFFVDLINESVKNAPPKNEKFDITNQILGSAPPLKSVRGRKRGAASNSGRNALRRLTHQYSKPALVECGADWMTIDPEQLIIDKGYRKHLQHHCSKIMSRIRLLHCIKYDIIKETSVPIMDGQSHDKIEIAVPHTEGDVPTVWWDEAADKSLLIGTFKHGYEKYRLIRNDPCLHFFNKLGPLQFNEKIPGSPDSINNPASVERAEDTASDPESVVSTKKKNKTKKEGDEEDSILDSEEEKDVFSSHNASPASITSSKEISADSKFSNNPETRWPLPTDMNTRLRRLFAAFMRINDKEHHDIIKAEKDKQKQVRLASIAQERLRKRAEMQQRWTRREESDFYKVLSNFGVVVDPDTKRYNWEKFRHLAKLDKKQDDTLAAYYEEFMVMCRKICGKATEDDFKRFNGSQMEEISEEKANRCIQRVKLLSKIRTQVLRHEKLKERLPLCQKSIDFPYWWKCGKHDKGLLEGVANHGLGRTEYLVLLDPDSVFKELVDKLQINKKEMSGEVKIESSKPELSKPTILNGEHNEEEKKLNANVNVPRKPELIEPGNGMRPSNVDVRLAVPMHTNEYAQLLSSWPKEKVIVAHLEKVCTCILKGEWPKPVKLDIHPMAKLPAFSRQLVSSVGHYTSAELTNAKPEGPRGDAASNRDFKIKSIDGLKLTVKKDSLKASPKSDLFNKMKRKRKPDDDMGKDFESSAGYKIRMEDMKTMKKKRVDGVDKNDKSHVQIHIPICSTSSTSVVSSPSTSKPIIHFPSNVKIPKVISIASSKTTSNVTVVKHEDRSLANSDHKPTVVKVLNDSKSVKGKPKDIKYSGGKSSDPPVGIHINSPNANVRIQGSKIEVKEKSSSKREIDLSEVILKVPDPSKFITNAEPKKTRVTKPPKSGSSSKPPPLSLEKQLPPHKTCEHKKQTPKEKAPPVDLEPTRRRPERSAKKRAKDSISEITEAERPIGKEDLHDRIVPPLSPPHHRSWQEMRSPPPPHHILHGRELYGHMEYYADLSPRGSPEIHRHSRHSPIPFHRSTSPGRRSPSPPLHTLHRPLSPPLRHRHSHSPPLPRHRNHSPHIREHEEHMKHFHFTEPLSPRFRASPHDPPFYYSERSRSPYYYDYRHEKERLYEELERRSPPIKHRRLSPTRELYSPVHKHEYIHIPTDSLSPVGSQRSHRDHLSPGVQEGRFPYGRVEWDSPRHRHDNLHSPSIRASPVDPQVQYQPLSRMTPKDDLHSKKHVKSPIRHHVDDRDRRPRRPRSPVISPPIDRHRVTPDHSVRRDHSEINPTKNVQHTPQSKASPTGESHAKKPKTIELERTVIEIPEETVRAPPHRKTPTRKKGLGLLEMKIQGLKSKMQQSGISEKIKEKMESHSSESSGNENSTVLSPPTAEQAVSKTKSLSDVISSLSEKGSTADIVPTSKSVTKRTKSLADITKNLAKSLEKSNTTDTMSITITMPKGENKTIGSSSIKPKISTSKLSDVISTLKEKSKAATAQLPASKFKDVTLSSRPANDSKLLDILKRGTAGVSPKVIQERTQETLEISKSKSPEPTKSKISQNPNKDLTVVRKTQAPLPRKSVISPVPTIQQRSKQNRTPTPTATSPITTPPEKTPPTSKSPNSRNAKSPVEKEDQSSIKCPISHSIERLVSPKPVSVISEANLVTSPVSQPLSPKLTTTITKVKSTTPRTSPRLFTSPRKGVQNEDKPVSMRKSPRGSLSPNKPIESTVTSSPSCQDVYFSSADSPVYSPAIHSNPVTVLPEQKIRTTDQNRDESSATPVITSTRTPTPVKSPLSHTLIAVRSPTQIHRLDSRSPGFPASPPQLIQDASPASQLTKPTAIMANTKCTETIHTTESSTKSSAIGENVNELPAKDSDTNS